MKISKVAVIGGGISGLLAAYYSRKQGKDVTIFEASSRVGGWIRSDEVNGRIFERGAQTLLAGPEWLQLFDELKLEPIYSRVKNRFILKSRRLLALPMNPLSFLTTPLFSFSAKSRVLSEYFRKTEFPEGDVSVAEFFERLFHKEIVDYAVDPFIGGIYAGNAKELSARSCFPTLWNGVRQEGSLVKYFIQQKKKRVPKKIVSFKKGLQELVDALARNQKIQYRAECENLPVGFDEYFLATPSNVTGQLLREKLSTESLKFLFNLPYQKVALWQTAFKKSKSGRTGFGFLVPRCEQMALLGSLWTSEIFEGRTKSDEILTNQFFSGELVPENPNAHLESLRKILDVEGDPLHSEYHIYERAIPQFSLYHSEQVQKLRAELPKTIHLVGNYLDGVGLSDILVTVKNLCGSVKSEN